MTRATVHLLGRQYAFQYCTASGHVFIILLLFLLLLFTLGGSEVPKLNPYINFRSQIKAMNNENAWQHTAIGKVAQTFKNV